MLQCADDAFRLFSWRGPLCALSTLRAVGSKLCSDRPIPSLPVDRPVIAGKWYQLTCNYMFSFYFGSANVIPIVMHDAPQPLPHSNLPIQCAGRPQSVLQKQEPPRFLSLLFT
ncbi:hypothetical protein M419DRAFT_131059 [Trichoderma reesei RUT C-30]|uniref:Uncharacterized protein n=1 Tax=Hypocrea jecorina (strain ATCC 56765 / BCRC 32924 / NRRL 11460 / Rut C-30) TaxID=1344414 RepID=A0A024S9R2_HYPJR|nr:hypothetical protein M419DRAFT_131059 [Trichoderma reesei RUT C-30]